MHWSKLGQRLAEHGGGKFTLPQADAPDEG
jgi:hypothetical protein